MQVPFWNALDFLASGNMNLAMTELASGATDFPAKFWSPGIVRGSGANAYTFTGNLKVQVNFSPYFGVLFWPDGPFATAHGTINGQDTSIYTVDFSSLVPGTGSVTAYALLSYKQIYQNPEVVVGPPPGHPSWDPNYQPVAGYTVARDSLNLVASTTPADNLLTFELFRVTLTAGQSVISSVDDTQSVLGNASFLLAKSTRNLTSNTTLTQNDCYHAQVIGTPGISAILPIAHDAPGSTLYIANNSGGTASLTTQTGDSITGLGSGAVNSCTFQPNDAAVLLSNGTNAWQVLAGTFNFLSQRTVPLPIVSGGTGSSTAPGALVNLGSFASQAKGLAGSYMLTSADNGSTFWFSVAGETVTLPPMWSGYTVGFVNTNVGAQTLALAGGALFVGGTLSGASSTSLPSGAYIYLQFDGTNWRLISSSPNFSQQLQAGTGITITPSGIADTISTNLSGGNGISISGANISAKAGTGLTFDGSGNLETNLAGGNGISISGNAISAKAGTGITFDGSGNLETNLAGGNGISISGATVSAKVGTGLSFDGSGDIQLPPASTQTTYVSNSGITLTNKSAFPVVPYVQMQSISFTFPSAPTGTKFLLNITAEIIFGGNAGSGNPDNFYYGQLRQRVVDGSGTDVIPVCGQCVVGSNVAAGFMVIQSSFAGNQQAIEDTLDQGNTPTAGSTATTITYDQGSTVTFTHYAQLTNTGANAIPSASAQGILILTAVRA